MDADDRHHDASFEFLRDHPGPLLVPVLVVAEVAHLIGTRLGAGPEVRFLGDIAAGDFAVEPVDPSNWLRVAELVAAYADLSLGTVDASVVALCERLGIKEVATFDHRHLGVVETSIGRLTLLP